MAVIALGLLAWMLSCFDAVSYARARENERLAVAAGARASETMAARENAADANNDVVQRRIDKDQIAVQNDQLMLQRARNDGKDTIPEQRTLDADSAALQADQIVENRREDLARANPDPQVAAAHEDVDIYQRAAVDARATRARDVRLAQALAAMWLTVFVLAFWTGKGQPAPPHLRPHEYPAK